MEESMRAVQESLRDSLFFWMRQREKAGRRARGALSYAFADAKVKHFSDNLAECERRMRLCGVNPKRKWANGEAPMQEGAVAHA